MENDEYIDHLSESENRMICSLRKRARWLEKRIMNSDIDLSWDKEELSALRWVIGYISMKG